LFITFALLEEIVGSEGQPDFVVELNTNQQLLVVKMILEVIVPLDLLEPDLVYLDSLHVMV